MIEMRHDSGCIRISYVFLFCLQPDFNDQPRNTDEELVKWIKFYEMSAPLICLGTMVTQVTVSQPLGSRCHGPGVVPCQE